jgi:hypothetical protein
VLTGQGSSTDVAIKNDAKTNVFFIKTGEIIGRFFGGVVVGGNLTSDADGTDNLGTTGVRWANLFVDDITVTTSIVAAGDITGLTLNATGGTTNGDNAAIGYSATNGIEIRGQGSTNDIMLHNDVGSQVLRNPTGTADLVGAGSWTLAGILTVQSGSASDFAGDVNVLTLTADGDTSPGDNATLGYASASGLVLTGQGSTHDITLRNDAGSNVMTVDTGTGVITTPLNSAVHCYSAGSPANVTGDGTNYTLTFDTERYDQNGDMDLSTNTFTFPADGLYSIEAGVFLNQVTSGHVVGEMRAVMSNFTGIIWFGNPYNQADGNGQLMVNGMIHVNADASDTLTITLKISNSTKTVDILGGSTSQQYLSVHKIG